MAADGEYVCKLDAATQKKALEELHEDPKNRLGAVETFRKWILDQKYIKCPTDTPFLLSFLRARKFSQLEARRLLENYLTRRDKLSTWFKGIDPADPVIQSVLDDGIALVAGQDKEGRRVFIMRPGHINVEHENFKKIDVFRAMAAVLEMLYMTTDEAVQVHGTVSLVDLSKMTMKHQTKISMDDRKNFLQSWQKNYPARIKGIHMYNVGAFMEFVMMIIRLGMSEKVQKRIVIHGQILEGVYKHIPMEALPAEYLPDDYTGPNAGTTKEIIEKMKATLSSPAVRDRIRYLTSPDFGINLSQKPADAPAESFRQLKVE